MNDNEIDKGLRARLDELKSVPPRGQKQQMLGRAKFLNEALKIEETVSAPKFLRHMKWIPIGKEKLVMNAVLSMIVVAGLLFGGGATVNAAQDDLPGQPLYAVKTASEDFSLQFQAGPEEKVQRLMDLAQLRIQEMAKLVDEGKVPPDQVRDRLEQHLRQALQTCTTMDEPTLDRTLLQLRDQLRQQDRDMDKLQLHAADDAKPLLDRTRTMLQLHLQVVEDGLVNHEQFRNTVRNGFNFGQDVTPPAPAGTQNQNQYQNQQQNGQPDTQPGGPNTEPGGPNTDPGGPNPDATPGPNNENGSGGDNGTSTGPGPGSGGSGTGTNTGGTGSGGNKP